MKRHLFVALLLCVALTVTAQQVPPVEQHPQEKPLLFTALPDKFSVTTSALQQLFTRTVNNRFAAAISQQLIIEGTVIEKTVVGKQQETVNVRCSNYANALLNISRIQLPDNKTKYTGRIVSPQHGDILALTEENGTYFFTRQKQLLTMVQ